VLKQLTSLLVLFINLLFVCFSVVVDSDNQHTPKASNTHKHYKAVSRCILKIAASVSPLDLEDVQEDLNFKFMESCSPFFCYSCTAKMSFYCLLSLLINSVSSHGLWSLLLQTELKSSKYEHLMSCSHELSEIVSALQAISLI